MKRENEKQGSIFRGGRAERKAKKKKKFSVFFSSFSFRPRSRKFSAFLKFSKEDWGLRGELNRHDMWNGDGKGLIEWIRWLLKYRFVWFFSWMGFFSVFTPFLKRTRNSFLNSNLNKNQDVKRRFSNEKTFSAADEGELTTAFYNYDFVR